jgi:DNA topoisomerase IB
MTFGSVPSENGHLQAAERYRYHPQYLAHRDEAKFSRMTEALALMCRRILGYLRRQSLRREEALAAVVKLLEAT